MPETHGNSKYRDSSSKIIFEDPILCAQFLKGYLNIPLFQDVQPEDIEDVTNRYVHLFTEERNSDVVKKVHIKAQTPVYLISLIEHKSNVEYNVVMQVFRYIVFIWEDYEKEMEKLQPGVSKTKGFRYPPILPIVFYDGAENSGALLREINVPEDEIDKFSEQIKERHMGKLFANFEPYDVQATRREAREEGRKEGKAEGLVIAAKQLGATMEATIQQLIALCDLDEADAREKVKMYW